ncbi:hypothetical protein BU26DRAFT_63657 [Trematosphaeria pertusa]|uniref:Uncharacterized protein n=1 Tax=Trematosphaeria pertusa TaxID=390896 RepID=A0A6A6I9H1_9PLEO|nr:uncharacterized protein BU26DRAFT_63657 [Trematosphaeria pertusa]KAF2246170.1 hypothetical protein BU26DRAFT_63657 [Trematosphaeria pertusa]
MGREKELRRARKAYPRCSIRATWPTGHATEPSPNQASHAPITPQNTRKCSAGQSRASPPSSWRSVGSRTSTFLLPCYVTLWPFVFLSIFRLHSTALVMATPKYFRDRWKCMFTGKFLRVCVEATAASTLLSFVSFRSFRGQEEQMK